MAIGCLRIGLDDTDAPGGLCTTWLGAVLARRLEAAGVPVRERRLVRLNPNAPFRTRGNAAIALLAEGDPGLAFELACAAVEEFAPLDAPMTNPGVVVAERPLPVAWYRRAVTDLCTVGDTVDLLDAAGARYRGYGNGRGLIGAAAAVAAEFPDRTYELLAYREQTRWGTPRAVDATSLFQAEAATFPRTWDSVDLENDAVVCVPHTPDPVLFGIRGESPEWIARARSLVLSEPVAIEAYWTTNQGTDAHLVPGRCGALREGRSYAVAGTVADRPATGTGGHVTAWLADGSERLRCMAYEPTKGFRRVIRALRPGDRVVACGSYRQGSLNLEKVAVLEVAPCATVRPPPCPVCSRRTTSAGRNRGWKCRSCGARVSEPESVIEERTIAPGWYEAPPVARRHLARPLCRGPPRLPLDPDRRVIQQTESPRQRQSRQVSAVPDHDGDGQRDWWNASYVADPCLFGPQPSEAALEAAARFGAEGAERVLELGAGHGRDTLHFARAGLQVTALDFADEAVHCLEGAAAAGGLSDRIAVLRHDVRTPLPFPACAFDAVYAHMLLCMALTDDELEALVADVRRVLRPGGLFVYTARSDRDPHCGRGVHHGGDLWETGGVAVRFFSGETVERLSAGWVVVAVREFEEGPLPRRLVCVTMRRPGAA
jgi:tRNA(Ile2)-agmatinylcytidine synthase